ncbi:MAG TPA: hypothetical protein VKA09_04515 [Nitrososphaeraceae archaeon]|nr:hypothetical protein [Nitrososphaeraceae archaeon]
MRALPYGLNSEGGIEKNNNESTKAELVKRIKRAVEAQSTATDSPLYQLIEGYPNIDHTKTDVFRMPAKAIYYTRGRSGIVDLRVESLFIIW